ncbi:MFS transporter [Siphonobacter sp.]|uniref:MFS transporter n=1 Tax=Siphonobacter sp. TaxID=1869184 RepID=UPI003B3A8FBB
MHVKKARRATLFIFLVCGLGIATWAPLVPFAKERLALNEAQLGLLLLSLGAGALIMLPLSSIFLHRYGSRNVILVAGLLMALLLPTLVVLAHPMAMGAALFFFGASMATVDVAMNVQALSVEKQLQKPIMSSFHGLYSLGGILGPLVMAGLLKVPLSPLLAASLVSLSLVILLFTQYKALLPAMEEVRNESSAGLSWPSGPVLFLGLMCFIAFLAEGSILDWSGVFLRDVHHVDPALLGLGYAAFSVAMTILRLVGDGLTQKLKAQTLVKGGALLASAGFGLVILSPWYELSLVGFTLVGLGAANIVPIFFSASGQLPNTSAAQALPIVTTIGYAGQLAGPALIGLVAELTSLPIAFAGIAALLLLVSLSYRTFH